MKSENNLILYIMDEIMPGITFLENIKLTRYCSSRCRHAWIRRRWRQWRHPHGDCWQKSRWLPGLQRPRGLWTRTRHIRQQSGGRQLRRLARNVRTRDGVSVTVGARWDGGVVLNLAVALAATCHAGFHLCLQLKLGSLWETSWWRWTGSAWRASPWAAPWRSWRATTACGWWWGGWARSPASVIPKRRPHGEVKGHRWIYYVCRALIFHRREHWDNLAWLINLRILMKRYNVPLFTVSYTGLCSTFMLKLKLCVTSCEFSGEKRPSKLRRGWRHMKTLAKENVLLPWARV